jgi:hypothetical protein
LPSPQCWMELRQRGLLAGDGLFTPAAVRAYIEAPPPEFPALTFYAADVGPGNAIYVPWRWAHQVHNIGECIAVSRFYVSRENFDAALQFFRTTLGFAPVLLLRTLIGTRAARTFFKRSDVRSALATGRSTAPLRALMRLAMKPRRRIGT